MSSPVPPEVDDPIVALFKVGREDHMRALFSEGCVYLETVEYFRTLDDSSPRVDPFEAGSYCLHLDGWTLDMEDNLKNWQRVGTIVGGAALGDQALATANLYCLHARRRSQCLHPFLLADLGYGPFCVALLDATEFFGRLQRALNGLGQNARFGLVEYVDRATYHGEMGPFRKFSGHRGDSEYRILVTPGLGKPVTLALGDLSDIAMLLPTTNRILITPKTAPP